MAGHIISDREVLGGKPVVAGTRLSVQFLLERLAAGASRDDLLTAFPELTSEGLDAALLYAAHAVADDLVWDVSARA